MPELTPAQRNQLIERINTLPISTILPYFLNGTVTLVEVPNINAERRQYLEEQLASMPNPTEQAEWNAVVSMQSQAPSGELIDKLKAYINHWDNTRPNGNHVDQAKDQLRIVEAQYRQIAEAQERDAWNVVNPFSKADLVGHLMTFPHTIHRDEIDNGIWDATSKENVLELEEYKRLFPNGLHITETNAVLNAISEWMIIKNTNDIFAINDYIKLNPHSPFQQQASRLLLGLKQKELNSMRSNPAQFGKERLKRMLGENIFTPNELVNAQVVTHKILDILMGQQNDQLPDINVAIGNSFLECKEGYTDVYFFGIPSTGKTCVLMGLASATHLSINLASGGGDYAEALQQYIDVGQTVPRTPGNYVTALEATIFPDNIKDPVHHKANLIEMSGEEFAFHIAKNASRTYSFEDMGTGATELLRNDNRKVFFLVIDPTAEWISINRDVYDHDDEYGNPITVIESSRVNQKAILEKMIDLFNLPQNEEIMKKVDAIHFIMTKADTQGKNAVEIEDAATTIYEKTYKHIVQHKLLDCLKKYNINYSTYNKPYLFPFSLGTFYVGGLYDYDPQDSNMLVDAIRYITIGTRKESFWDKIKRTLN